MQHDVRREAVDHGRVAVRERLGIGRGCERTCRLSLAHDLGDLGAPAVVDPLVELAQRLVAGRLRPEVDPQRVRLAPLGRRGRRRSRHRDQLVPRRARCGDCSPEVGLEALGRRAQRRREQVVLAVVVVVERPGRGAGLVGDVTQRRSLVALARDHARGCARQLDTARALDRRSHDTGHPVTAAAPRLTSSFATTTRWISDVPSQIRSTRRSRYRRSTGFSRM